MARIEGGVIINNSSDGSDAPGSGNGAKSTVVQRRDGKKRSGEREKSCGERKRSGEEE